MGEEAQFLEPYLTGFFAEGSGDVTAGDGGWEGGVRSVVGADWCLWGGRYFLGDGGTYVQLQLLRPRYQDLKLPWKWTLPKHSFSACLGRA